MYKAAGREPGLTVRHDCRTNGFNRIPEPGYKAAFTAGSEFTNFENTIESFISTLEENNRKIIVRTTVRHWTNFTGRLYFIVPTIDYR